MSCFFGCYKADQIRSVVSMRR